MKKGIQLVALLLTVVMSSCTGGKDKAAVKQVKSARIQMRQLDWNRIDTERKLNMQVVSYRNNMTASSEQVVSNKENVMQAEKAVQIAGKRYEVGKGTVLELNSSQVSLTQAQLTYNQSIYDYLVAKADLDQVLGKQ